MCYVRIHLSERRSFPEKFFGFPARIYAISERADSGANPDKIFGLTFSFRISGSGGENPVKICADSDQTVWWLT